MAIDVNKKIRENPERRKRIEKRAAELMKEETNLELDIINRLYLELSQIATAETKREKELWSALHTVTVQRDYLKSQLVLLKKQLNAKGK